MKRSYERPLMSVELFMANQAVSTCTVEGGISWTFDCMYGPNTDTRNVISNAISGVDASCNSNIGYAPSYNTARDYSSRGSHSDNTTIGTWTTNRDSEGNYLQVVYAGAAGILYADSNDRGTVDMSAWSKETGYVKHASSGGSTHHMVAPVIDTTTIRASM